MTEPARHSRRFVPVIGFGVLTLGLIAFVVAGYLYFNPWIESLSDDGKFWAGLLPIAVPAIVVFILGRLKK